MDRTAKSELFDAFAAVARALANGRRAELVDVLAQGERSVQELASEIGQSVANTSQHLRYLDDAGLVRRRRDGSHVRYRLASDEVERLWAALRDVAAGHVAGFDERATAYLGDRSDLEEVAPDELAVRGPTAQVWDVRPAAEYRAGHLPGAMSVPPEAVPERVRELAPASEVVAYCRGPYCAFADEAVRVLLAAGHRAARLEGGFPEWRRDGRPVATGAEDAA
ncbi:MAG TPA: metalloregulator ArsR/SmtB family transcription factor [Acidimicrobiales bacterium]|nr:metalloregulator ArsR/SmtB family transcription factor [Acidimicrobiales bacterium]